MATVYPDSVVIEYYDGSAWVDISAYVVSNISGNSGFASPKPDARVASLGILSLDLNNVDKKFTPWGGDDVRGFSTLTGWKKGAKIRVRVIVAGRSKTAWIGQIADIRTDDGTWGSRRVHLTCKDYVDILTRYPMKGSSIMANQTIDQAVTSLLARIAVQPDDTSFDVGTETLPAPFSNVQDKTKAISELNKLVMSELGFGYVLKDGTLRIENSQARKGTRDLDQVNQLPGTMDNLLLADDDDFLLADGDTLLLEEPENAQLAYTAQDMDIRTDDDQTVNSAYVEAYPVKIDTSLVVVFSLGQPIAIAGGASITLSGKYTNPTGGSPINATNLQTPTATTDYLLNAASDGSGTNLTANLTVTATYYGDRVDYVLTNAGAFGYITKLQARGYGIYFDNPIEGLVSDDDAIDAHGDYSVTLDQRYKRDLYSGLAYAASVIEQLKDPKSKVVKASFLANSSEHNMMACLELDVGSLLSLYENRSEMSKWYYIFSRAFIITLGGILTFTFGFVEAPSLASEGFNPVAVEFSGTGSTDGIDFGYLPHVSASEERTFSIWMYQTAASPAAPDLYAMLDSFADGGGVLLYTRATNRVQFYSNRFSTSDGRWYAPDNSISLNAWHHVAVTFKSDSLTADPIIYIDGVSQTVTEDLTMAGTLKPETGARVVVGNLHTATGNFNRPFAGKLKDARIYSRILSASEIATLYNSGVQDYTLMTDGMVFQGLFIDSDLGDAASLDGQQIPAGHNYFENIMRNVGTPNSSPIIR